MTFLPLTKRERRQTSYQRTLGYLHYYPSTVMYTYVYIIRCTILVVKAQLAQWQSLHTREFHGPFVPAFPRFCLDDHCGFCIDMHTPIRVPDVVSTVRPGLATKHPPTLPHGPLRLAPSRPLRIVRPARDPHHVPKGAPLALGRDGEAIQARVLDELLVAEDDGAAPDERVQEARQRHERARDGHEQDAVLAVVEDGPDGDGRGADDEDEGVDQEGGVVARRSQAVLAGASLQVREGVGACCVGVL